MITSLAMIPPAVADSPTRKPPYHKDHLSPRCKYSEYDDECDDDDEYDDNDDDDDEVRCV